MWLLTFVLTTYFSFMDPAIAFWLFGGWSFLSFFFVLFHLPETQGKTFQEIQDMIQGKKKREQIDLKHENTRIEQ